jgi:hypothetical protein
MPLALGPASPAPALGSATHLKTPSTVSHEPTRVPRGHARQGSLLVFPRHASSLKVGALAEAVGMPARRTRACSVVCAACRARRSRGGTAGPRGSERGRGHRIRALGPGIRGASGGPGGAHPHAQIEVDPERASARGVAAPTCDAHGRRQQDDHGAHSGVVPRSPAEQLLCGWVGGWVGGCFQCAPCVVVDAKLSSQEHDTVSSSAGPCLKRGRI